MRRLYNVVHCRLYVNLKSMQLIDYMIVQPKSLELTTLQSENKKKVTKWTILLKELGHFFWSTRPLIAFEKQRTGS
jgi:hypothetical protein